LQSEPNHPNALHLLGVIAHQVGKNDTAVDLIARALALNPDLAEAHSNLGLALQDLGKLDEAVASYHKALALNPDYPEAHNNLGNALKDQGKQEEAVASYGKALALKPDYAEAQNNLGLAFQELEKLEEAVAHCHKAIAIKPDYAEAYVNLGRMLIERGCFAEAKAAYDQGFHINHGGPWRDAATFADGDSASKAQAAREVFVSPFALQDIIDRLEYLITKGRIDPSFQRMVDGYCSVLAEIQLMGDPEAAMKLTSSQLERIGSYYNRAIHRAEAPRIGDSTVNESLNFKQIEDSYLSSPLSVTTLDDFLTPEALLGLRDFCLESTIFFTTKHNRFVQGKHANGFNCDLLYQIVEEVKERFPKILDSHHLANMWVYRYNNQSEGVAAHTDEGAVTLNLWITPDDANLIPSRGGLIIYTKEQPYDWDWRYYNSKKYIPAVSREIDDFLADADTVTIPYRENRAVLFHSTLFHKSDQIHFRDGFENRRMSLTLLFGKRKG
jgi:tetratricopeptide (TPR) repeat protein